jgi:hypothetical protein
MRDFLGSDRILGHVVKKGGCCKLFSDLMAEAGGQIERFHATFADPETVKSPRPREKTRRSFSLPLPETIKRRRDHRRIKNVCTPATSWLNSKRNWNALSS